MFRTRKAKLLPLLGAALLAIGLLAPIARGDTPAPGYGQFAGCPSHNEDSTVAACFNSVINSGHFQMGSKDVPITKPLTLSGGYQEGTEKFVYNSKGGLSATKLQIPGGVIGITGLDWLVNFLSIEQLKLYAVTELAGVPSSVLFQPFKLPVKVHLINPALGNNCYVGSNSNPIKLNLDFATTSPPAPNKPITGKAPEFTFDELGILNLEDGTYVDNSFAAPGASGCVLTLFGVLPISLNGLVNLQAGLPSPAGTNETVQNFDGELVEEGLVYP